MLEPLSSISSEIPRSSMQDSTDPNDKVYVILNLVAEGTHPLLSVRSSDYALDTAVLYRRVILDLLRNEQGLRPLIGFQGESKSVPDLPSRAVDWTHPPAEQEVAAAWEHNKFWFNYTAHQGLPMLDLKKLTSPDYGEDVLNVNGVLFDKILVCTDIIAKEETKYRPHEMVDEVDNEGAGRRASPWRNYADNEVIMEGIPSNVYWREDMLRHQRLFITENGAAGLGPSGTSIEDKVRVLSGGHCPFLLGPLDENDTAAKGQHSLYHYTFRGDVFVPRIMAGEAVDSSIENQGFVHIH
ncbi:hypothetical protein F5Y12DRAFT_792779 [Xylaria sp. FL1777]|nr:hypothetical protein F5Y12DRAFT_792779 [Xylaria sp. FL1777]